MLLQHAIIAAAAVSISLIAFPAEVFNSTLKENYRDMRRWFGRRCMRFGRLRPVRWLRWLCTPLQRIGPHVRAWLACAVVTLVAAALYTPVVGRLASLHHPSPWLLYLGTLVGLVVVTVSLDLPALAYLRRRRQADSLVRAFPATLLVAGASLALVVRTPLEAGYLYGLVAGYALDDELPKRHKGRAVGISCLAMFVVSLTAWALRDPIDGLLTGRAVEGLRTAVDALLVMVIGGGLQTAIYGLLPFRFLDGAKLRDWSIPAWGTLVVVGLLLFAVVLVREEDYVLTGSALAVLGPFLLFGLFSAVFWACFAVRHLHGRRRQAAPIG